MQSDIELKLIKLLQNDSWGKKGTDSVVAQLWSKTPGSSPIDDNQTYSEVNTKGIIGKGLMGYLGTDFSRCGWELIRQTSHTCSPRVSLWGNI